MENHATVSYAKRKESDMSGLKWEKNILTELTVPSDIQYRQEKYNQRARRILWLEDEMIKGAFSVICSWYLKATEEEGTPSHVHDFDEVCGFFGNNPDHPEDLGGEIDFWMEDEKYTLDKSCLIYIPRDIRHCPLRVTRVDRPFLFLAVSTTSKYTKDKIIEKYAG
jgi:hypothetical protein